MEKQEAVSQIREFNRFYTVVLGFLNRNYLDSGYSVTETRMLFELRQREALSANRLIEMLQLDKSYVSRLVHGFEKRGLIIRKVDAADRRSFVIRLTEQGKEETDRLIQLTNREIGGLIEPLRESDRERLCGSMGTIMGLLSGQESGEVSVRPYRPGDPSLVCKFYYDLFARQYGFNGSVEAYFIRGMAELFDHPGESQLWVAERGDTLVGCIAVVRKGEQEAQLRWFGVDMAVQGMGVGKRLLETAMEFCREQDYRHVILWTIDILKPARHLYGQFEFVLTETKPNVEWADHELLEEKWEYHRS